MYLWKLKTVLAAEGSVDNFVRKSQKAKLSSVWIKLGDGESRSENVTGSMENRFREVARKLREAGTDVWGWHIPYAATEDAASREAQLVASLADSFGLAGVLMDAESGPDYFQGDAQTAEVYAGQLRTYLDAKGKGLAMSSHDIPTNVPDFPFDAFAQHAVVNAPQVYYGGSPSVENRLNRAIQANSHLTIPFVPVGAGWVGDKGGCSSEAACAERAVNFMGLVRKHGFPGYSFWHWHGAPLQLWEVLFREPV